MNLGHQAWPTGDKAEPGAGFMGGDRIHVRISQTPTDELQDLTDRKAGPIS